jgi:hypothetical protein
MTSSVILDWRGDITRILSRAAAFLDFYHKPVKTARRKLTIIHAEAKDDGSVMLSMANGIDLPLTANSGHREH